MAYLNMLAGLIDKLEYDFHLDNVPYIEGVYQGEEFDTIEGLYEILFADGRES
ncbi:Uncharacterised protein [Moraxella caviae]|uniref:Uncharacterized protein n=1 Tax=Moraxella caviae TaxID=34060 RepID=A0A378RAJ4_9GAMM|nr:hypothetical protein [Moraxella caviae]STZ13515.1 Uncharacterised protein [Moraxella caviae]STZ13721.1 Uncharacterised protein [Moraxella caviae]